MLRVSCGAPGASVSQRWLPERRENSLPLTASSRTAFVFAAAASAPPLQRPRALENATHEARDVRRRWTSRIQCKIPCSPCQISSTRVGLRLPACYRKDNDNLASGATPLGFQGGPRSSIHLLHQRFA